MNNALEFLLKSCGSDAGTSMNAWNWRHNYNSSTRPVATSTAVTLVGLRGTRTSSSSGHSAACTGFVRALSWLILEEKMLLVSLSLNSLTWRRATRSNQVLLCVGIYFHWDFFTGFLFYHIDILIKLVQQKKPNSSLFLGVNLEIKGKLQSCSLQSLTIVLAAKVWTCSAISPLWMVPWQTIRRLHYLLYGLQRRIKLLLPKHGWKTITGYCLMQ